MNCIKITISGQDFLLQEPNAYDDYEFPTFIHQHLPLLKDFIENGNIAMNKFAADPLTDHFKDLPDIQYFKDRTGIIGSPFTMQDTQAYIFDKKVNIVMEVNFDE